MLFGDCWIQQLYTLVPCPHAWGRGESLSLEVSSRAQPLSTMSLGGRGPGNQTSGRESCRLPPRGGWGRAGIGAGVWLLHWWAWRGWACCPGQEATHRGCTCHWSPCHRGSPTLLLGQAPAKHQAGPVAQGAEGRPASGWTGWELGVLMWT